MHEYVLRKDNAGMVRLHVRKSSQAATWMPEGKGYQIFALGPSSGPPPLSKLNDDSRWQLFSVECTVRCWFNYFAHPSAAARTAAKDW
eukprot:272721-Pleurochrysis_carterae.AAC.1